ncbi:MAG: hypothetical protein HQK76_20505 [Desulfobacterales bacterium]|nr:hypothetical protein [Desulfobacterales bacterium]
MMKIFIIKNNKKRLKNTINIGNIFILSIMTILLISFNNIDYVNAEDDPGGSFSISNEKKLTFENEKKFDKQIEKISVSETSPEPGGRFSALYYTFLICSKKDFRTNNPFLYIIGSVAEPGGAFKVNM